MVEHKSAKTKSELERIPKYILYQILIHVRLIDLSNMVCLNKYFRDRILDIEFWKFNVKSKFNHIPDDMTSKNIPNPFGWYYMRYKIFNDGALNKRIIIKSLRLSLSDRQLAGIDEDGTLYVTLLTHLEKQKLTSKLLKD